MEYPSDSEYNEEVDDVEEVAGIEEAEEADETEEAGEAEEAEVAQVAQVADGGDEIEVEDRPTYYKSYRRSKEKKKTQLTFDIKCIQREQVDNFW
tara:strand:- start:2501 stop:2785 length:285 start_codon:yes stop_codon:yes gene_type:complete